MLEKSWTPYIFIFVGCLLISYILTTIYFKKKVSRITNQLRKQENYSSAAEYLDTLKIDKSTRKAMMYIVVGLATLGEYFVDGSLTDYIINIGTMESSISILLQVVTFFPSESRKMDVLFKKLFKKKKMTFADRFLIYQVYRIKLRRLMSDTKDTIETYNKLKTKNDQCKVVMRNFWDQASVDVSYLSSISIILNDLDSFFKYAISNNPNNLRITNEYADFLAECMTDFDKAIYQSVRAELIGNGRNFNVDISFRSVVNKFPRYLKDHILDTKGRRINLRSMNKDVSVNASKSGSGSNSIDKGEGSSFSVDIELQEVVSKRLIRDSKVRLAFFHSIMGMKPIQATLIYFSALTLIVTCLSCYIGFVVNFDSRIIWRKNAYGDIRSTGYSLFFTFYANFITIMQWAKSTKRYDDNRAILGDITIDSTTVKSIIDDRFNRPQKIIYAVNFSRNSLTSLFKDFFKLADEYNVYDIGTNILRQDCKLVVCSNNKPFTEIKATVKDHILMMNFFQSSFAGTFLTNETIPNIYDNNDWCQVFGNSIILSQYSEKSLKSILDFNIKEAKKYTVTFKTWMIVGSIAIILLSAGPALIIINTFNYHINKTLKMLLALPTHIKEDAKKPIVISNQAEEEPVHAITKAQVSKVMDYIAIGFFTLLFSDTAVFCVMCYRAIQANEDLTNMYEWYYLSCVRVLSSTQAGNNAIHLLLLNGSLKNDIISIPDLRAKALKDLDDLISSDKILLDGNNEMKKIIGYDEQYDKLQLQEVCSLNRDPKSVHDMYACAGIGHQIIIFKNMVTDILNNPSKYDGVIDDEVSANIAHLLQYHFFPRVIAATTRMRDMIDERYAKGVRSNRLLLIGGLVLSFIMEILPWVFRYFVNENYKLLLIWFKRISPQAIVDTPEIMEFFKSSKKSSKEENMSISKSIVMDASECIIITNQNAIVEIINSSVTANLSMTPDQMLGQHIANFVSTKEQQRLNQQIDLMMSGQGSTFWQDHIELVNETAEVIPFAITMIGMKDKEESTEINSIVFILTNEIEEKKKREEAEIAKAKSEKLLYQILPKDIVVRLNRGETDISFTINSATIFFIDIVKFSNYSSTLTPTEIMTNLSLVFATFDKIVAAYPTITKIKLIGDVYMAAAGLFNDNPEDTKHAEEAVRCCIQCQKSMEEINMKLNASLEIRIGVNSGGPLIGGVLGSDKPTFDIIGDPINVAARLQSTDIPGNVQISAGTKELIENLDFDIEERGEIYLKGKGKQMTYFASKRDRSDIEGSFAINIQEKKDN